TPWNTYVHRGLPPGPICNPGLDAIKAAAFPARTNALYFVARGDGSHVFSRTLSEHNRNVRRYQLRK
ncbi:MAG: aminodeoxychorismate lyase, partial [Deltaproteobacteria bacterium]